MAGCRDSEFTVEVDDPATGPGVDFAITDETDGDGHFEVFDMPFPVKAGDLVTVSQEAWVKTHVVIDLRVTLWDSVTDTISGVGLPDTETCVDVDNSETDMASTEVMSDDAGVWTADFSSVFDIQSDTWLNAWQSDADGDSTHIIQSAPNPTFCVDIGTLWNNTWQDDFDCGGWDWAPNATVTITVGDPGSPDFQTTFDTDEQGFFQTGQAGGIEYDVAAGDLVTVTDGTSTKDMIVAALEVTDVDSLSETVSGSAPSGDVVEVEVWDTSDLMVSRYVTAADDAWTADFSTPGPGADESNTWDIESGTSGAARVHDEDGDFTQNGWGVPSPYFSVSPLEPAEHMWGEEWAPDSEVAIEIDDPDTTEPVDFSMTAATDGNGRFELYEMPFDIQAGHLVTVSQGATVKTHVVIDLTVTQMDPVADTVSGMGKPDTDTVVNVWNDSLQEGSPRIVTSDGSGAWTADFSVPGADGEPAFDIQPGVTNYTYQADADGDQTQIDYYMPSLPAFEVHRGTWDVVFFKGWTAGETLTLTIEDPATTESPDYETSVVAEEPQEGSDGFGIGVDYEVLPGDVVTVTDGSVTKSHTVTDVAVTEIDTAADVVHGTAAPGSELWMYAPGNYRLTSAAVDGTWTVDFSVSVDPEHAALDIVPGTTGGAEQFDADGDSTVYDWQAPRPDGWQHNPATSHDYLFVEDGMSWADAEAYAVSLGGHLVTINDAAENDWLIATFGAEYYIGMNDRAVEGTWVWASGEPVTFTGWFAGEPNDYLGEDAAVIENRPPIGWNDVPDSWGQFVVERATLAETGHITGTVTYAGGIGPLDGLKVTAFSDDWVQVAYAWTNPITGDYDIGGLATGDYRIYFRDDIGDYVPEYYDDQVTFGAAQYVPVSAPDVTSGIDAELALAGRIQGRVTDAMGAGLSDIFVEAIGTGEDWSWDGAPHTMTNPDGTYDLGFAPAGDYHVQFTHESHAYYRYVTKWFDDKSDFDSADDVTVTAGADDLRRSTPCSLCPATSPARSRRGTVVARLVASPSRPTAPMNQATGTTSTTHRPTPPPASTTSAAVIWLPVTTSSSSATTPAPTSPSGSTTSHNTSPRLSR